MPHPVLPHVWNHPADRSLRTTLVSNVPASLRTVTYRTRRSDTRAVGLLCINMLSNRQKGLQNYGAASQVLNFGTNFRVRECHTEDRLRKYWTNVPSSGNTTKIHTLPLCWPHIILKQFCIFIKCCCLLLPPTPQPTRHQKNLELLFTTFKCTLT
jgi:hypothetical protein